jgi:hypothetical protein
MSRTVRPTEFAREWDINRSTSWGYCKVHPTENQAHISIHADFDAKTTAAMRQFARWMMRTADYLEKGNE